MIATILPKSSNFHAVLYNERKVAEGDAVLLEMANFSGASVMPGHTPQDVQNFLIEYSAMNDRIKYPQFHVAISCKGHECTETELLEFAHAYLEEMGYNDPGQPVLIYAHRDTSNTHLHIVTSRIRSDGSKIDHSHERRRSEAIVQKLSGKDRHVEAEKDLAEAFTYRFNSMIQFQAIMQSMGYECYLKNRQVYIKKGGVVQLKINEADIKSKMQQLPREEMNRFKRQITGQLYHYRDLSANHRQLVANIKKALGLSIIYLGSKDTPYGYIVVDHKTRTAINGQQLIPIAKLLTFPAGQSLTTGTQTQTSKTTRPRRHSAGAANLTSSLKSLMRPSGKTHNANREHEVGQHRNLDDLDTIMKRNLALD